MFVLFQLIIMIISRLVPRQSDMPRRPTEFLATCLHLSLLLGTLSGDDICQLSVVGVHVSFPKIEQVVCFIVFIPLFELVFSYLLQLIVLSFFLVRVLQVDDYAFFFRSVDLYIVSFMLISFFGLRKVSVVDLSCIDQFPNHD